MPAGEDTAKRSEPSPAEAEALEVAQSEEEIEALKLNEEGAAEPPEADTEGTGPIHDEIAAERMEELTESGPDVGEIGVLDVAPGRQDTSERLERGGPEMDSESKVDEGGV